MKPPGAWGVGKGCVEPVAVWRKGKEVKGS